MRIGIIAGEVSGDILGAGLIQAIRAQYPHAVFEGVAGPRMIAAGCHAIASIDRLAVMGFIEPLRTLPSILRLRRQLIRYFTATKPDVVIGIDAAEFNLSIESKLKRQGIKVVHYVSPQVWAWRENRVGKLRVSTDRILVLFPFEQTFYQRHALPVTFVGHPMADEIPFEVDTIAAKRSLNLDEQAPVVAVLPGSRRAVMHYLAPIFLQAMQWCAERHPDIQWVVPLANEKRKVQFEKQLQAFPVKNIHLVLQNARTVLSSADVVLTASGTATLEAMLLKKPMVVAYAMSALTHAIAKRLVKTPFISLPNILANEALVPELIQSQATPMQCGMEVLRWLNDVDRTHALKLKFDALHRTLKADANERAAEAVLSVIEK